MIRDKNKIQQSAYVERHEGLWAFRPAETHDNQVGMHEGRGQFVLPDDTNATTQQLDLLDRRQTLPLHPYLGRFDNLS